jgi:site-specific recombinase XerD
MKDLREALEIYQEHLKTSHYSPQSLVSATYSLNNFLGFLEVKDPDLSFKRLYGENVSAYLDYLRRLKRRRSGKPLRESSRERLLQWAKNFLAFLCDRDIIPDLTHHLWHRQQKEKLIKNILSEADMQKVLSLPDENTLAGFRDKTLFELLYLTGIRKREAACLTLYDLRFEEGIIFIRQGKGRKDRSIPMGPYLQRVLREYTGKVRPHLIREGVDDCRLFVGANGASLKARGLVTIVERYRRISGLEWSLHTFRHSFATHLLKRGTNIVYIQKLLGHSYLSTTQIYTRVYPVDLKEIILKKHPRSAVTESIPSPSRRRIYNYNEATIRLGHPAIRGFMDDDDKRRVFGAFVTEARGSLSRNHLAKTLSLPHAVIQGVEAGRRVEARCYLSLLTWLDKVGNRGV